MDTGLITQVREDIDTDRLTNLSDCLSAISMNPTNLKPNISILPNAIKTVLDYALERKKIIAIEKRDQKIYDLYRDNMELQERENQRTYSLALKQHELEKSVRLTEILSEKEAQLAKIQADKKTTLATIKKEERLEIKRLDNELQAQLQSLNAEYSIKIRELDDAKERYLSLLNESSRRFNKQMEMLRREQYQREQIKKEALLMCAQLRSQAKRGVLDPSYLALMQIAMDAQKENFELIDTLNRIFAPLNI